MNNEIKNLIVPKLRFPEFHNIEGWEKKEFNQLFEIGNGRDYKHLNKGHIPVYGSGGYMLSVDDYLYEGDSVCIGRKGTIDKPMFLTGKFWTVDTLFYTHSFKNCLPKFIYSVFQNVNWLSYNEAGGVPSLSKTTINKIEAYFPRPDEQQKISDCLSSLDELITAESQKLDIYKAHKKGLMQQLFPAEGDASTGSAVPTLRFAEFKDSGEWEEKTLEELGEFTGGGTPSKSNQTFWEGKIPWISSSDIEEESIRHIKISRYISEEALSDSATKKVSPNSILLVSRVGVGKLAISKEYICTSQDFTNFTPKSDDVVFLAYLLKSHKKILLGFSQGMAIKGFTKDDISKLEVLMPSNEEQHKIADCLSSLDELITAQSEKIEALKTHKKGLMQGLFPIINEVNE